MTIPQSYQKSNAASTKTRNILDSVTVYNLLSSISFIKTDKEAVAHKTRITNMANEVASEVAMQTFA